MLLSHRYVDKNWWRTIRGRKNLSQSQAASGRTLNSQRFKEKKISIGYRGETTRAITCVLLRYNAFLRESRRRSIAIPQSAYEPSGVVSRGNHGTRFDASVSIDQSSWDRKWSFTSNVRIIFAQVMPRFLRNWYLNIFLFDKIFKTRYVNNL